MTDDEKTAESAAGLIPEPSERRDPIEQIRQMHAEVHSVHPADPAECNCSKCALLAEIDRLQRAAAQARLEEAKWWAAYCVFLAPDPEKHPTHHPVSEIVHMKDCNCEWHKRIAALEAALKGTSSRP